MYLPDMIRVEVTPESREMYSDEVLEICQRAASAGVEIPDDVARVIATYFQSPGTVGRVLATLASGLMVHRDDLNADISATTRECYGKGDEVTDLMIDMLATWALNYGKDK